MKRFSLLFIVMFSVGLANASIDERKNSVYFDHKFECDTSVPTGYTAQNGAVASSDGDILTFNSTVSKSFISDDWPTATAEPTGWTFEVKFKIGTDYPDDYHIQFDIGSVEDDAYHKRNIIKISANEVYVYDKGHISTDDLTTEFHTLRVAQESGSSVSVFWLDGVKIATYSGSYGISNSILQWGAMTSAIHGAVYFDYIRFTGGGAFAPYSVTPTPVDPFPADGAVDISVDQILSWHNGSLASSHDVYIGTDYDEVLAADRSSTLYKGNISIDSPSTFAPELGYGATYYWRVDAVNDLDFPEWHGDVWSFTTNKKSFIIDGDLNGDNFVDIADLEIFASQWLNTPGCPVPECADFDGVNGVDLSDFTVIANNWNVDTPPTITLIGNSVETVEIGSTYVDPGAVASDLQDGDITSSIVVDSTVDTSVADTYTVTYNVTDSAGNNAAEVTRTVEVTTLSVVNIQKNFDTVADNYDPLSSSSPIYKYATGLSTSQITFNHFGGDTDTPDGSAKSFYIDADVHDIDYSERWYYYFALPLPSGITNLHGQLAASFDIKMDANATAMTTISVDVYGCPILSKVIVGESFPSDTANTWQKVNLRDLSRNFSVDAPYAFVGYQSNSPYYFKGEACDIQLDDIGRELRCLMIRVLGYGPKNFKIRVDNYSLTGTQMDPIEWDSTYLADYTYPAWHAYHDRVDDIIDAKEAELNALEPLPTLPANPSDKQDYRYEKLNYYKNKIASNISAMRSGNAYRTGPGSWVSYTYLQETNDFLARYKATIGVLKQSITSPASNFVAYKVDPMKFGYLDGYTFPMAFEELTGYNLRMARGERKSIEMILDPAPGFSGTLTFENTDFTDGTHSFAASNLDKYIAKIWYQAGRYETEKVAGNAHFLTQELLLKNESLVRVTHSASERSGPAWGENELWVTYPDGTNGRYINISTPSDVADPTFPDPRSIKFNDSESLQPFALGNTYKALWSIVNIPEGTPAGTYTSTLMIKQGATVLKSIPLTVEVLPFDLSESRQYYGLYYHGKLIPEGDSRVIPLDAHQKTHAQQRIELQDMFDHGVYYPGHYESSTSLLGDTLAIQNSIGFPKDRFYSLGLPVRTYTTLSQVQAWQDVLEDYGYDPTGLYMYGYDEASGSALATLIDVTENVVYAAGAKVFCAIYSSVFDHVGDYMDVAVYGYGTHAPGIEKQIADWHSAGQEIYAYSDPQVGVENPEIYRRDYGLRMIKMGFDGAFDYAYQKIYGVFWNDFDTKTSESTRREETFTYPTSNGIVGTVQWEGYAAAITDSKYLATLQDIRDAKEANGEDVSAIDSFIANINPEDDLDVVRDSIIDEILSLI